MLVLVSGGIAYFADGLGRKMGKKRITIGKLRPRHTAALGTILSGILISSLTIAIVFGLSSDVRQWALQGAQAIRDLQATQKDLKNAKSQQDKLTNSNKELEVHNKVLEMENKAKIEKMKETDAQVIVIRNQVADLQSRKTTLEARIVTFQNQVRKYTKNITDLGSKLKNTVAQFDLSKKEYTATNTRLTQLRASYQELSRQTQELQQADIQLRSENETLGKGNETLKASNLQLNSDKSNLETSLKTLTSELDKRQTHLSEVEANLTTAEAKLQDTEDQYTRLKGLTEAMNDTVAKTRIEPIIFRFGEEITRIPVEANMTARQAGAAISAILRASRLKASDSGAKEYKGLPVAGLFAHTDKNGNAVSPADLEANLVRQLTGRLEPGVLISYSSVNAFAGEPVPLDIKPFANPTVYHAGELISETRINGNKEVAEIIRQLTDFIGNRLKTKVKIDGMIPRAGSDESFGSVGVDEIVSVVTQIRSADRMMRVQAIAINDTRAGDPLKLEFRIR